MSRRYKILVAEDNDLMLDLLCMELQELLRDVTLAVAHDGLQAMQLASADSYDLIISDNVMPGIPGSTVLREIRAGSGPNQHTPFIFCSGNFTTEDMKGLSACYLLPKPFDMRKFQTLLRQVLPE